MVFDDIVTNEQIQKRAEGISSHYDELIELTSYWHLLGEGTHSVNGKTITVNLRELKETLPVPDERERAGSHPFYVSFCLAPSPLPSAS